MLGDLTNYLSDSYFTLGDQTEFCLRILLAAVCGIIIGWERSKRLKEAGVRTHCIIACTAATVMILSKYCFVDVGSDAAGYLAGLHATDPARMAAQVVSGVSFLGAGVIFRDGSSLHGLTTAAGIWATAAVGMALGAGMYWIGLFALAVIMVSQLLMHRFPIGADAYFTQNLFIEFQDSEENRRKVLSLLQERGAIVTESQITRSEAGKVRLKMALRTLRMLTFEDTLQMLENNAGISEIQL